MGLASVSAWVPACRMRGYRQQRVGGCGPRGYRRRNVRPTRRSHGWPGRWSAGPPG